MRLHRPYISLGIQLAVAKRQLAAFLGCEIGDLECDHDPALSLRVQRREGLGRTKYIPDACDPDFLIWRSHAAHVVKTRISGDHGQYSDLALIRREKRRKKDEFYRRQSEAWERFKKGKKKQAAARARLKYQRAKPRWPKPKRKWASRPFPKRGTTK